MRGLLKPDEQRYVKTQYAEIESILYIGADRQHKSYAWDRNRYLLFCVPDSRFGVDCPSLPMAFKILSTLKQSQLPWRNKRA